MRAVLRVFVALALTFASATAAGADEPDHIGGTSRPRSSYVSSLTGTLPERVAAWREQAVPPGAVSAVERPGISRPVADLDADGLPDVLAFTTTDGETATLTCRRGTDGTVLASLPVPAEGYALPADPGWTAVLLVTLVQVRPGPTSPPEDVRLTVSWVERCAERWTRTFQGRIYGPGGAPATLVPALKGTLDARGRRAVLVEQVSHLTNVSPNRPESTVTVLSGDDGATLFGSEPRAFLDEYPTLVGLPDVTGDGLGDYAYSVWTRPMTGVERTDRFEAYSMDDGSPLWSVATPGDLVDWTFAAGDTTGDGVTEVVLASPSGESRASALVDGAAGEVLWERDVGYPMALALGRPADWLRLAGLEIASSSYWLTVTAVDATGKERYRTRRRIGPVADAGLLSYADDVLGDVDADGVLDVAYHVYAAYQDDTVRRVDVVVSGRTGAMRDVDVSALLPNGWPSGSGSVDGRGDDAWTRLAPYTITSGDGTALAARWQGPSPVPAMLATRLDRDRCPDLLVVTGDGPANSRLLAVSGATGRVVWSVPPAGATRVLDRALPLCAAAAAPPSSPRVPFVPATGGLGAWPAAVLAAAAACALRLHRRAAAGTAEAPMRGA
ncbi:MAG TPA: hypothetical protein VNQ77_16400 [Frankiaceae bacterium]|nr:hypothetical protein [Frankiaceae bacterium]